MERKLTDDELENVIGGINLYDFGRTKLFEEFVGYVAGKTMKRKFDKIKSNEKIDEKQKQKVVL